MKKRRGRSRTPPPKQRTLAEIPFRKLVQTDPQLSKLREEYAAVPAKKRRKAAEWAYDSAHASCLVAQAVGRADLVHPAWHDAAAPLAIDPEYAPAILSVGSLEYQYGRPDEAMALFLSLTSLPDDAGGLPVIIDRAGDFLIDQDDYVNAGRLYAAAAAANPEVALYYVGLGYCVGKNGQKDEPVAHARRAAELEPDDCRHLNDLGFALTEAGQYEEAERVLERAVELAPPEDGLPKGNLQHLRRLMGRDPQAGETD